MPITEILTQNARKFGQETSLIEREPAAGGRREITWLEFDDQANRCANALIARGIAPGDRVAILMMNCLEWLPIYFGILRTGALAVPLNFRFTADEIKKCIEAAGAKALFYGPEFIERIAGVRGQLNCLEQLIFVGSCDSSTAGHQEAGAQSLSGLLARAPGGNPGIAISDENEAALYFTSGTTGTPKPIILTHANLMSACITENTHHGQTHADNFVCIPPLYHTGAKMHWFGSFFVGSRAVILRGVKPKWILDAVSEERATIVWLLVPWAQDILDAIENGEVDLKDYQLDQWRLMHIGAQPVPPSLIRDWLRHFPNHQYDTNYGLSESTGPGCVHLGLGNIDKVGAIGVPGHGWETMIVDDDGKPVPYGQEGELIIRGPGVMKGYYHNPEATSAALRNDWLYTGDMCRQDADGFIYLVDRKKDVVISGGENIFPVEIENFLQAHADIKDVAVIGMPDKRLGEVPVAIVEPKTGRELTEERVLEYCESLPRYKRPRRIFLEKVPRNATGKIEKPGLRERFYSTV
jgi:acyl-CoA synthetase (AMP-forming)/AMP-acid ligase II